jgi:hypothetical protein
VIEDTKDDVGSTNTMIGHNDPDRPSFSAEEIVRLNEARDALGAVAKLKTAADKRTSDFNKRLTYEFWIGQGIALQILRNAAKERRLSFEELRKKEGLDDPYFHENRDRRSRLLKVVDHLARVEAWRENDLTDDERRRWASAEAICKHCPTLPKRAGTAHQKQLTRAELLKENEDLKAEIVRLKADLKAAREQAGAAS